MCTNRQTDRQTDGRIHYMNYCKMKEKQISSINSTRSLCKFPLLILIVVSCPFSKNTTVTGSPDHITATEAKGYVDKTPPSGPPNAIDPIGEFLLCLNRTCRRSTHSGPVG